MVESMAKLKPWQIVALGGLSVLAGMTAVAVLATAGYTMFPDGFGWVAVFHILGTGAAYFFISRPFIEAYIYRGFLDDWRDILADHPPLGVFDDEEK